MVGIVVVVRMWALGVSAHVVKQKAGNEERLIVLRGRREIYESVREVDSRFFLTVCTSISDAK